MRIDLGMSPFGVNEALYRPLTPAQLDAVRAVAIREARRQEGRVARLQMTHRLDRSYTPGSHTIRAGAC